MAMVKLMMIMTMTMKTNNDNDNITSTQGSEGSVPGSPAGQAAFGSLGRDKARAVARTIAQVNISLKAHGIAFLTIYL